MDLTLDANSELAHRLEDAVIHAAEAAVVRAETWCFPWQTLKAACVR